MKASSNYPIYTAVAVAPDGTKYDLKKVTTDLIIDEPKNGIADKVNLELRNVKVGSGYLSGTLTDDMRIFVTANDGKKKEEVFRGYIWDLPYSSSVEKTISIKAYNNPIYLQQSKDCLYFSKGKYTDAILKTICNKWGIKLSYSYDKISHPKLPLNNKALSDMIIEILDAVKKQKGMKYVIRSIKDVLTVSKEGTNTEVYKFERKKSAVSIKSNRSKDKLVTKVVIYGNADDDERREIEATVNGSNLGKYGTLQDIVTMSSGSTLAEAKQEAKEILAEHGTPEQTYEAEFPDIPWVHKGDLIYISAGNLVGYFIVVSVTHDARKKTMSLEVKKK